MAGLAANRRVEAPVGWVKRSAPTALGHGLVGPLRLAHPPYGGEPARGRAISGLFPSWRTTKKSLAVATLRRYPARG
jgi:hypothetical protein